MYLSAVSSVDACLRPNCDSRSLHIFSGICCSGTNGPVLPTWGINWLFSVLVAHTGMCAVTAELSNCKQPSERAQFSVGLFARKARAVSQLGVNPCHGAETLR